MKFLKYLKISQFNLYIENYGGYKKILGSPYFCYSLIISFVIVVFGCYKKWYESALAILPNIVGISIGAYAILLSLSNEKLLELLAKNDDKSKENPFMSISSSFCHFIFVQTITIIVAYIFRAIGIKNALLNILGNFLFIYSIMLILATTFAIFFLSNWIKNIINRNK